MIHRDAPDREQIERQTDGESDANNGRKPNGMIISKTDENKANIYISRARLKKTFLSILTLSNPY